MSRVRMLRSSLSPAGFEGYTLRATVMFLFDGGYSSHTHCSAPGHKVGIGQAASCREMS